MLFRSRILFVFYLCVFVCVCGFVCLCAEWQHISHLPRGHEEAHSSLTQTNSRTGLGAPQRQIKHTLITFKMTFTTLTTTSIKKRGPQPAGVSRSLTKTHAGWRYRGSNNNNNNSRSDSRDDEREPSRRSLLECFANCGMRLPRQQGAAHRGKSLIC